MKTRILAALLAASFTIASYAQNLNPQVQVTNDFKTEMGTVSKQTVAIEIPDSLTSFKRSVSYNVFSTPYKGAYEFLPYEIQITPQRPESDFHRFWLKAGAGYTFRPVLQAVWTPLRDVANNTVSVYQDFEGYGGNYSTVDARNDWSGHDWMENAGVSGHWFARDFTLGYGVDYKGIYTADFNGKNLFHNIGVNADIHSDEGEKIAYEGRLNVNHASDQAVGLTGVRAEGSVHPDWVFPLEIRLDFGVDADFYDKGGLDNLVVARISPKVLYEWNFLKFAAGVTLSPASDLQWLYPDLSVSADFFDIGMQVYGTVTGGQYSRNYSDFKLADHWFGLSYVNNIRPTLERLNASLGLRGRAFSHLQYDLRGGWASYTDAPMHSLKASAGDPALYECGIAWVEYNLLYADALVAWRSRRVDSELGFHFKKTNVTANDNYLDLPRFSVNAAFTYNWNSRIYAGIWCEVQSKRDALTIPVKGFVNLGLSGEYRLNKTLSVWAKAGNLLNQQIAISPLHAEKGMYLTAGVSLNLR